MRSVDRQWVHMLDCLMTLKEKGGKNLSSPRAILTSEVLCYLTTIPMDQPILGIVQRELDYSFMAGEALWILDGSQDLDHHPVIRKNLQKYSDDNRTMHGAYGPRVMNQIGNVIGRLCDDEFSRQAVMSIWRRNPMFSKDIPCTLSLQFLIRQGFLNIVACMRSSDAWLGWPYDVFTFSMIGKMVQLMLKDKYPHLILGDLNIFAGSQHCYNRHWKRAENILNTKLDVHGMNFDILTHGINTPDDLRNALRCARDNPKLLIPTL